MASDSRPPVPIALGSATGGTEEGRDFFQSRLRLFGGWIFAISGAFNVSEFIGGLLALRGAEGVAGVFGAPNLYHFGGTLAGGAVWLLCRVRTLSQQQLRALDVVGVVALCTFFALMAVAIAVESAELIPYPMAAFYVGLMACHMVLIARAISIPSTPQRTLWLGALAMVPMVLLGGRYVLTSLPLDLPSGAVLLDLTGWSIAGVAMATIASRVIFGLRAEVASVRKLGQYTLEGKIGEGGMGIVSRARTALLSRPTAVKLLPPGKAGAENLQRFEREVQLTATLSHPSTVVIFDYGRTPEGVFYYAMEYLDGLDLEQLVRVDGAQPAGRVIHILAQVSGALAEAHDAGLIHRDIKPSNIILTERGGMPDIPKVVDFGLVKQFASGSPVDSAATAVGMTAANTIVGTPLYLSPEAIAGRPLDGRSDLYALGAVGYYLLTGRPVFEAQSVMEISAHHLHTAPPAPSASSPHPVPDDLDAVLLRCLAKDPDDRYAGSRALQLALHGCAQMSPWPPERALEWWAAFRASREGRVLEA